MPRRKRGRDKRRSDKKRNRKQDLPALNVTPFYGKSGTLHNVTRPSVSDKRESRWEQRIPPHEDKTLKDAVVVSQFFNPKRIKLEDIDFERLYEQSRQVRKTRKRRARLMLQLDMYDLSLFGSRLEEYQQYEGAKDYVERDGFWYIQLIGLNIEIALFETESKARTWAWEYLGRV